MKERDALFARLRTIHREIWGTWNTENDEQAYAPFSHREKVVSMIFYLDSEVQNGGFRQWIGNPTGMYVVETRNALLEIGATEVAGLVDRAMRLFSGGCPARQWSERYEQCRALSEAAIEELDKLGDPYADLRANMLMRVLEYWDKTSGSAGQM
jgi:hypothetical protein